jgi:hypothetical protein
LCGIGALEPEREEQFTMPGPVECNAQRRVTLTDDLSEDDLARDWSLTPEDLVFVATCRCPDHRRRFALELCMLRAHGRFLDDYRQAPVKIIGVVQNSPFLGYTGEREPPSFEARFWFRS